ncbi:MAG: DNA cytosine methyltransferase [Lysobacter sp.]
MPDSGENNLDKLPVPRLAAGEVPVISLFCGAGGLDHGFDSAGFRTIFAADSMQAAVSSFNHNANADIATVLDLLSTSSADIAKAVHKRIVLAGASPRGLIGGPPCQGVSNANNQSGPEDPRNRLFARYSNIVLDLDKTFGLDFFVFENVPGLKAAKNKPLYDTLKKKLGKAYELHEAILDASKFGVPQTRRRLIIVGISKRLKGADFQFPVPAENAEVPTVKGAIGGLPEPIFFARGASGGDRATHVNHWTMAPKSKKFSDSAALKDGRSFIRLEWDAPSRTVAYGNREIHVHPSGTRRLSIYEALRLQGFPKSFELLGNLSEQVTQVSNAVPPPVAAAVARSIAAALGRARILTPE